VKRAEVWAIFVVGEVRWVMEVAGPVGEEVVVGGGRFG
jgi:hypothetical protein